MGSDYFSDINLELQRGKRKTSSSRVGEKFVMVKQPTTCVHTKGVGVGGLHTGSLTTSVRRERKSFWEVTMREKGGADQTHEKIT